MDSLETLAPKLNQSARKYRSKLLQLPAIGLKDAKYMTARPGVRYEETSGLVRSDAQLRPYNGKNNAVDTTKLIERTLRTYLGSCVENFDPNSLRTSIFGQFNANAGKVENKDMNKAILFAQMKSVLSNINKQLFAGVRKGDGSTTHDLFNGLDTIAKTEIAGGMIAAEKGNYIAVTEAITKDNAVDVLKSVYAAASEELQDEEKLIMPISRSIYNAYCEDYKTTTGAVAYNTKYHQTFLEGTDDSVILAPMSAKKGSSIIQLTTKENMLYGYGNDVEGESIEIRRGENAFLLQFVLAMFFGVEYNFIEKEKLMICEIKS